MRSFRDSIKLKLGECFQWGANAKGSRLGKSDVSQSVKNTHFRHYKQTSFISANLCSHTFIAYHFTPSLIIFSPHY